MTQEFPKVKLNDFDIADNEYNDGQNIYHVFKLIHHSKKYKEFDLPLCSIDMSFSPWSDLKDVISICEHFKRINESNTKYPILLDSKGYICDGWHRVCKAIILGKKTIKAIRLETMPIPDRKNK